jgi:hypothetical protein
LINDKGYIIDEQGYKYYVKKMEKIKNKNNKENSVD